MRLLTKLNKSYQLEAGRSMIEMLGVLAVIGVLTIGGVTVVRYALQVRSENSTVNAFTIAVTGARTAELMETGCESDGDTATATNGCIIATNRVVSLPDDEAEKEYFITKTLSPVETRLYDYATSDDTSKTSLRGYYVGIVGISPKVCEPLQYSRFVETCAYIAKQGERFNYNTCLNTNLKSINCNDFDDELAEGDSRKSKLQVAGVRTSFTDAMKDHKILYVFFGEGDGENWGPLPPPPPPETTTTTETRSDGACYPQTPFPIQGNEDFIEHRKECEHWVCTNAQSGCGRVKKSGKWVVDAKLQTWCMAQKRNQEPQIISKECCETNPEGLYSGVWLSKDGTPSDSTYDLAGKRETGKPPFDDIKIDCCVSPTLGAVQKDGITNAKVQGKRGNQSTYTANAYTPDGSWNRQAGPGHVYSAIHGNPMTRACCEGWQDYKNRQVYKLVKRKPKSSYYSEDNDIGYECCKLDYSDPAGKLNGLKWDGSPSLDCEEDKICPDPMEKNSPSYEWPSPSYTPRPGTKGNNTENCCPDGQNIQTVAKPEECCGSNGRDLFSHWSKICCSDLGDSARWVDKKNPSAQEQDYINILGVCCAKNDYRDMEGKIDKRCCTASWVSDEKDPEGGACCKPSDWHDITDNPNEICCKEQKGIWVARDSLETEGTITGLSGHACCGTGSDGKDIDGNLNLICCMRAGGLGISLITEDETDADYGKAACCSDGKDLYSNKFIQQCCDADSTKYLWVESDNDDKGYCCVKGKATPLNGNKRIKECCVNDLNPNAEFLSNGVCCTQKRGGRPNLPSMSCPGKTW